MDGDLLKDGAETTRNVLIIKFYFPLAHHENISSITRLKALRPLKGPKL